MSSTTSAIERLRAVFAETFHVEVPDAQTDLLESGILDSFQMVELLLQLERHFGLRVSIDQIELDNLRTLQRIARLIASADGAADRTTASQSGGGRV